jgi:probable HAF family extracellular repeat protein
MVDLGTLGGDYSTANDINDVGDIVGESKDATGVIRPVWWDASGVIHELDPAHVITNSFTQCPPVSINNAGTAVGTCPGGFPFLWTAAGGMQVVPLPSGVLSAQLFDINDAGQAACQFRNSGGMHPCRWSAAGGFEDVGSLGGSFNLARGINNLGQVVGTVTTPAGDFHAFFWDASDGLVDLGIPPGESSSFADAINDAGAIAGQVSFNRAVVWNVATPPSNTPPVASAGGPYTGTEGSPVNLALSATDADGDNLTLVWDLGDGTNGSGTPPASHVYADNGTYAISLTVSDGRGGTDTKSTTAVIGNAAPLITNISGPLDPVQIGTTATVTASFADAGTADTHTATIAWGDGAVDGATPNESGGSGTLAASHGFTAPGVYTVTATVADDDGAVSSASFRYVVVFDPTGGFVTGGGWFDSPLGAYAADPSLTGRASLGFVAKYAPGAPTPTGNTEFQFKAGNLTFKSSEYQWLVVAGARAQFKGTGTVNGGGSYTFLITAVDGQLPGGSGVDLLRVKIWSAGGVIYDNKAGASDADTPSTALGGGSIVIHR